ncbi:heme lyase CcmF/NrfE family subunit [Salidesulfovibrio brasiliensis]|uniref:heme lyase CcmF/NrfE family subunit n=1 Tax=Salidesulfovibrio brasiliensis TaxID=221711 RepID=UPI0006D25F06|nr:cytochrome c-type biogenesis CcmF C-terminal domain-containing protein [Salidesulfovibrio brasiliensis]
MHLTAYAVLLAGLLLSLFSAAWAARSAWQDSGEGLRPVELGSYGAAGCVIASSVILLAALMTRDYSFQYVYENVDETLSFMYTITGFWGGRAGSLLFWELIITVSGVLFSLSPRYRALGDRTKLYFWVFFLMFQAFFLLLLTCWSNPFIKLTPTPLDGRGLNPLLRNPGMIFHPPLLFLGFAGYTVPACAALAAYIAGEPKSWVKLTRNWSILAWVFLTAGIVLGGWWSYMELGWGGYWAWDPVENASLIPWFAGTAFLHTAVIEARRGALQRTNVVLISMTLLLCVFSTYLTRSGVIESLHTFGKSAVALPLVIGMVAQAVLTVMVVLFGEKHVTRSLSDLNSRQGLLVACAWFLLALGLVVTLGTMWPVISQLWSTQSVGLGPDFYNRVTLPFLSLLVLMFAVCPWLGWKSGIRDMRGFVAVIVIFVLSAGAFWFMGYHKPLAVFSAASAVAAIATVVLLFLLSSATRKNFTAWGQYGIHLGVAMLALGIAFSGPYKVETEAVLGKGETVRLGGFDFTYIDHVQDETKEFSARLTARLAVKKDGEPLAVMHPEKRIYRSYPGQQFAEVSVVPSLGDELYATVLGITEDGKVSFQISVNPLVNWVWIGGTVMCVMGLALFRRGRGGV